MAVKSFNPTSPARRQMTVADFSEISSKSPEKKLLAKRSKTGGRNSYGRITVRHIGGGNRRKIRVIDWKRVKDNVPATVKALEYDPNRTAYLALLQYTDGEKAYILAPEGIKVGSRVVSGPGSDIVAGNAMPLDSIPVGTVIHNIELKPGKGSQMVRTAGAGAQLLQREEEVTQGIQVHALLQDIVGFTRHKAKQQGVAVTLDLGHDLGEVVASATELQQVILNLVNNAIDAIAGPGGRVLLRARQDSDYISIDVEDTGQGIPADVLPRIFEPFFTTKPMGKGTGLGLAICRDILAGMGASISVDSVPGHGTAFHVRLPRHAASDHNL